jgi:hypothetical protein
LNRTAPITPLNIPPSESELPINCILEPTRTGIKKKQKQKQNKTMKTLKNGTASKSNEIPVETVKADIDTAVNILHSLFSKIWMEEKVPAEWKERRYYY